MVQSGIDCLYSRGNVWSPVISAVKANSPLPSDNGASEFNRLRVGLCLSTRALRLMIGTAPVDRPAQAPAAPTIVPARKFLRERIIASARYARLWRAKSNRVLAARKAWT